MILAATWSDGLFVFSGDVSHHELAGQAIRAIAPAGHGGALAIVDGHSICHRTASGPMGHDCDQRTSSGVLYGGRRCDLRRNGRRTNTARQLRRPDRRASAVSIRCRAGTPGMPARQYRWPASRATARNSHNDGYRGMAPRFSPTSMSAAFRSRRISEQPGSPRSILKVTSTKFAHILRGPEIVAAAAAAGLCISRDLWSDMDHQAGGAARVVLLCRRVCRRRYSRLRICTSFRDRKAPCIAVRVDGSDSLTPLDGGFPKWTGGIVDTGCIAARESSVAVADQGGNLYLSADAGRTWSPRANGLPGISGCADRLRRNLFIEEIPGTSRNYR